ncbi:RHS repeat-associated core domain-containing protein [Gottfriedia solisilvae]|uniref:RHS repeat-associated core domain-containing protein n=1 Tax=Gottfriedia solisilvae TaxID=1516104 RepID=UPI003D2F1E1F
MVIGEEYDPTTDTQYLRARHYDVGMGRFISKDTYLGDTENPLSRHLCAYTKNDPVNQKDPSGNVSTNEDGSSKKVGQKDKNYNQNAISSSVAAKQTLKDVQIQLTRLGYWAQMVKNL